MFFPHLVYVAGKPAPKKTIIGYTFLTYFILYALAPTPFLYPLCVVLSLVLSFLLSLIVYFKIQNFLIRKNPLLIKQFEHIDQMSGFEFEEFVGNLLILKGYRDVRLTKKTVDYGVDAVCSPISPTDKRRIAIQIKRYATPVSVGAVQEVVAGAAMYKADLKMVITNSTFTNNAKLLAENNDCVLIDRLLLQNWVYEVTNTNQQLKVQPLETITTTHVFEAPKEETVATSEKLLNDFALEHEIDALILADQISFIVDFTPPQSITANSEKEIVSENNSTPDNKIESLSNVNVSDTTDSSEEKETLPPKHPIAESEENEVSEPPTPSVLETKTDDVDEDPAQQKTESITAPKEKAKDKKSKSKEVAQTEIEPIPVDTDLDEDIPEIPIDETLEIEPIEDELEVSNSSIDEFEIPDL